MRTTRSTSRLLGVCLSECWDTQYPLPSGVGLDPPPPPGVGMDTPPARPPNFPPGCGPRDPPPPDPLTSTLDLGLDTPRGQNDRYV